MNNKFSIIIPLYNKELYITNTISSVLNQKYDNYEIIIVDDCSQDNSLNIIKDLASNNKITIHKNDRNSGVSYSRNRGIELATGNYIMFLDADDEISNTNLFKNINDFLNKYKIQYILLTRNYHNKFLRPNFDLIKNQLELKEENLYKVIDNKSVAISGNFPFGGSASAIISISLIDKYRFDVEEERFEDWLYFLQIYLSNEVFYFKTDSIRINYDQNSLSRKVNKESIFKLPKVYHFLDKSKENKQIRKEFFWKWMNSNIKLNMNYNDIFSIYKRYNKEFKTNFSFSKKTLNIIIRIILKFLHSLLNHKFRNNRTGEERK